MKAPICFSLSSSAWEGPLAPLGASGSPLPLWNSRVCRMPNRTAMSTVRSRPTRSWSATKAVFGEVARAIWMVRAPAPTPSALLTV